jgi:hypothetical protein
MQLVRLFRITIPISRGLNQQSIDARDGVGSFLSGILGGIVAWSIIELFVRPLTRFFALRTEAADALAVYEDRFDPDPDAPPPNSRWLTNRTLTYDNCGADLMAFAASNPFATRLMHKIPLRRFRYQVRSAGSNMLSLAATAPGTEASDHFRQEIAWALKFRYRPRIGKHRQR